MAYCDMYYVAQIHYITKSNFSLLYNSSLILQVKWRNSKNVRDIFTIDYARKFIALGNDLQFLEFIYLLNY